MGTSGFGAAEDESSHVKTHQVCLPICAPAALRHWQARPQLEPRPMGLKGHWGPEGMGWTWVSEGPRGHQATPRGWVLGPGPPAGSAVAAAGTLRSELEPSPWGEREPGRAGGILKIAAGRRVSGTLWSGQSCRSNPIAACLEERRGGREGKNRRTPPSHLSPCPGQRCREPGPQGTPLPGRAPPSTSPAACAPWRGSTAAVAGPGVLGFINKAAWRWGPTQPPPAPSHLGSPPGGISSSCPSSPLQPAPLLWLCELGPEVQSLWTGPGAKVCGRT